MLDRHVRQILGSKLREYFKLEEKLPRELEDLLSKLPNHSDANQSQGFRREL